MIISIGGTPGSGKSTIGKMLAAKLNMKRYYMGQILRDMARQKGLTLQEYLECGKEDATIDKEVDDFQKRLAHTDDNFIIEGRTSYLMIPHSLKIFLKTDLDTAAIRIFNDMQSEDNQRNEDQVSSVDHAREKIKQRMQSDIQRYHKYYDTDVYDESHFDIIIDTTNKSPDKILKELLVEIEKKR